MRIQLRLQMFVQHTLATSPATRYDYLVNPHIRSMHGREPRVYRTNGSENTPENVSRTSPLCVLNRQQFTASDRRAVVESLLQREDVVTHLFDMFFPVASSARDIKPLTSKE